MKNRAGHKKACNIHIEVEIKKKNRMCLVHKNTNKYTYNCKFENT